MLSPLSAFSVSRTLFQECNTEVGGREGGGWLSTGVLIIKSNQSMA